MKIQTFALVAVSLFVTPFSAYAAIPTGSTPFRVTVPNLMGGVELSIEGLYVQPSNSDLTYLTAGTTSSNNVAFNNTSLTPQYDWGFAIGLGYIFPNSGNDFILSWTHFDQHSNDSTLVGGDTTATTALGSKDTLSATASMGANSNAHFAYDAVDLDMGQYLSIGTRLRMRLFAGVRYATVKNVTTDTYTTTDSLLPSNSLVQVETFNSKFTGIGPRLGIDTSYHVSGCFGVVAHFATALLVGRTETNTTNLVTVTDQSGSTTANNSLIPNNQARVVPAFDGKLGLNYTMGFKNGTSNMTVEAGYQVTQYVDALDRVYGATKNSIAVNTTTSSVGFNGPYLSLNFKI